MIKDLFSGVGIGGWANVIRMIKGILSGGVW